jgi:hypothetical protein
MERILTRFYGCGGEEVEDIWVIIYKKLDSIKKMSQHFFDRHKLCQLNIFL